jgi:hypothetical protein
MTIEITKDENHRISIMDVESALHFTAEAIRDIAKAIEDEAKLEAPLGATGELKAHPVEVNEIKRFRSHVTGTQGLSPGEIVEPFPSFGGGLTARGGNPLNRGQFSRGKSSFEAGTRFRQPVGGQDIEEIEITIPEIPEHARWVHDGTGIYGPIGEPITVKDAKFLVFFFDKELQSGDKFVGKSVKGQKANPYLERAFVTIERDFIPVKIEELRLEIKVL